MTAHRRLTLLTTALALLVATGGLLSWLVLAYMPIREGVAGPFAAWSQTPADSTRTTRYAVPESSWPMFGGSAARTRFMPSRLHPPFSVRYAIPGGGGLIEMPPVVARRRVVFGTHEGLVVASRLRDGRRLWTTDLGRCIASSPAVRRGVVYIGWSGLAPCRRGKDERGGIVALSLWTGEVLWRFRTGNVESSPAIADNKLFFAAFRSRDDSMVYAMRLRGPRRIAWSYPLGTKVASSPALIGRTLLVSAYDRNVYAFDSRTGRVRWETSAFSDDSEVRLLLGVKSLVKRRAWTEGGYYATPAIAYGRAFLGTIDGVFSAFDVRTGAHRWSRRLGSSIYGSAAVWHERVYVGTLDGTFHALAARDGRELWSHELGGRILGSPTVTNGRVFIATTARETFVLDARTGEVEWRFPDGHYSPLVVAGKWALVVGKGRVYGLVSRARTAGWQAS
jgi:outer membrane protein assembly factor BamB